MKENSKTPYYVINHKGDVIGVVTGGRGIKRYLQEHDAHAVGNGNHRIKGGDIVYFMGGEKMIYIGMRLKGRTVVEIKTAPGYVSRYADPEQQPLKYSPVKNMYYVECNNPHSNRYLLRAYLE